MNQAEEVSTVPEKKENLLVFKWSVYMDDFDYSSSSSSSIYFLHSINNKFEQKWITKNIRFIAMPKATRKKTISSSWPPIIIQEIILDFMYKKKEMK